jgi:F-type H+-transporting ATPase subunit delta
MADSSTIARPYAKALFDIASAERKLPAWSAALNVAAAVIGDEHARRVLGRPSLTEAQRVELVTALVTAVPGGEPLGAGEGQNLLKLLAENDRLAALPEIAAQFDALKAEAENKVKVTLVAASQVDTDLTEQVTRALAERFGRTVELSVEIDASLIGGAVIRAEDMVIDGSVRTRLQRLTETLIG